MVRLGERHTPGRTFRTMAGCTWFLACFLVLSVTKVAAEHSVCLAMQPSPNLTMFVERLFIPEKIDVSNGVELVMGAYKITQKLHRDLPPTILYAYGTSQETATYPGPTLMARKGVETKIRWENHITDKEHIFQVDRTLHWADPPNGGVPIVVHLHGAETQSEYDGHPDSWFTAGGDKGHTYTTQDYVYPNNQREAQLWYHDHTVGMTRLNVAAGLAGLYFIKSEEEDRLPLPSGDFEIPLVVQDRQFWANGSINYPDIGPFPVNPNWCADWYGDTILVNGKVWPYLDVLPTMYRFRILIAANDRFFNFSLSEPSLRFIQIGTDGGFLHKPRVFKSLLMAPAYRNDVIIDFSKIPVGTTVYMNNSAITFFPDGNPNFPDVTPGTRSIMAFRVVAPPRGSQVPKFSIPKILAPKPDTTLNPRTDVQRNLTLSVIQTFDSVAMMRQIAVTFLLNNRRYMEPVSESPQLGTTEIWTIINFALSTHPIHLHLTNFLLLDEQPFNFSLATVGNCSFSLPYTDPSSCFTGPPEPPAEEQIGWRDTVIVYHNKVTRLLIRWQPREGGNFSFDPTTGPGYVWHCHMLDHEDNDMMRPLVMRY